jgi:hypothetical protein
LRRRIAARRGRGAGRNTLKRVVGASAQGLWRSEWLVREADEKLPVITGRLP